jgi:hypothetical protein
MHPKLLLDVIKRQAGSIEKAITEGVMNAIEAGSPEVRVTATQNKIEIIDTGRGFSALDEIQRCFEMFGAPHTEEENKIWANFRMGRGQMFSFGVNTWRTGLYTLRVDIENKGLNYDIEQAEELHNGCHITIDLYKKLESYQLYSIERALVQQLAYAPVPIYFNGELISKDPSQEEWTMETEDAYIRTDANDSLYVYNIGIMVRTFYSGSSFGVGGIVVSKKQLQVNFARNDIQSTCPVWQRVGEALQKLAGDSFTADKAYSAAEIERIGALLSTKQHINKSVFEAKLIQSVTGRVYSMKQLCNMLSKYNYFTAAPGGSRVGDKLQRSGIAFVVDENTLKLFRVSSFRHLINLWLDHGTFGFRSAMDKLKDKYVAFNELTQGYHDKYETFDNNDCSKYQQAWLHVAGVIIEQALTADCGEPARVAMCGESAVATAWTDGKTYIAYDKSFLNSLSFTLEGVLKLGFVTLHELQHGIPDTDKHSHDQSFYEDFHDACLSMNSATTANFARAVSAAYKQLPAILKKLKLAEAKAKKLESKLAKMD